MRHPEPAVAGPESFFYEIVETVTQQTQLWYTLLWFAFPVSHHCEVAQ
jgi:hypothetical protein